MVGKRDTEKTGGGSQVNSWDGGTEHSRRRPVVSHRHSQCSRCVEENTWLPCFHSKESTQEQVKISKSRTMYWLFSSCVRQLWGLQYAWGLTMRKLWVWVSWLTADFGGLTTYVTTTWYFSVSAKYELPVSSEPHVPLWRMKKHTRKTVLCAPLICWAYSVGLSNKFYHSSDLLGSLALCFLSSPVSPLFKTLAPLDFCASWRGLDSPKLPWVQSPPL